MSPIRILVVDDHEVYRGGLRLFCESKDNLEWVGEATNGQEAIELTRRLKPDVVVMDIKMPVMNGVEAARLITSENSDVRVLMLTFYSEDEYVFEAIKSGARGYILKTDEEQLMEAIEIVYHGGSLINPYLATKVLDEFQNNLKQNTTGAEIEASVSELSDTEMKILKQVARGASNQDVAKQLCVTEKTVANRLTTIYHKLQVNNRTQAVLYALRQGWSTLD